MEEDQYQSLASQMEDDEPPVSQMEDDEPPVSQMEDEKKECEKNIKPTNKIAKAEDRKKKFDNAYIKLGKVYTHEKDEMDKEHELNLKNLREKCARDKDEMDKEHELNLKNLREKCARDKDEIDEQYNLDGLSLNKKYEPKKTKLERNISKLQKYIESLAIEEAKKSQSCEKQINTTISGSYFLKLYLLVHGLKYERLRVTGLKASGDGATCWNIPSYINNIILPKSNSASDTRIVMGDVVWNNLKLSGQEYDIIKKQTKVVLKLSALNKQDNSLEVEREIYRLVINDMVLTNATPNVSVCFASFVCDKVVEKLHEKYKNNYDQMNILIRDLQQMQIRASSSQTNILMMEKIEGPKFNVWMDTAHSTDEWTSVLFQIYYTLMVFNFYGLRHNDLHSENILMKTGTDIDNSTFYYFVNDTQYFAIPVKDCPKIYDFDFSSSNSSVYRKHNIKLDGFCIPYGICDDKNPKFDTFTITWMIYEKMRSIYNRIAHDRNINVDDVIDPDIRSRIISDRARYDEVKFLVKFCKTVCSETLLSKEFAHGGRLCNDPQLRYNHELKMVCNGDYVPNDEEVKSPIQILGLDYFKEYLKNLDTGLNSTNTLVLAEKNIFRVPKHTYEDYSPLPKPK